MSVSGFHYHFKAVTAIHLLQFQKHLRLQEARRLMLDQDLDATSAGYRVGYAGQFGQWVARERGWRIEVIYRPDRQVRRSGLDDGLPRGFRVIPRRWWWSRAPFGQFRLAGAGTVPLGGLRTTAGGGRGDDLPGDDQDHAAPLGPHHILCPPDHVPKQFLTNEQYFTCHVVPTFGQTCVPAT